MKKEYIAPTVKVVELKAKPVLLAGSVQSLGVGSGSKSASEALSRDGYFDFNEDEY